MNKVTSYLKNVGKSFAYATSDYAVKLIPEVKEFVDTNEEVLKAVYAVASTPKQSIKNAGNIIKKSGIYKDISTGIDNVFDDIKTGNFYNKDRAQAGIDNTADFLIGGGDDDEFDFNLDDWDDSFDDNFDDESSSVTKGDVVVADAVVKSGNASSQLISRTVAATSSNIIQSNVANTKMSMANNMQLAAGIRTSIMGLHESINGILKFVNENIPNMKGSQEQYFTDSMNVMKENNAILKEMLEMQRNVYAKQQEEYKSKDQYGQVFSGGTLDLKEYFKVVGKNIKGLDPTGMSELIFSDMGGGSMLSQAFTNPLGGLITGLIKSFIPKDFAKQVVGFSKSISGIFPALVAKMNRWAKDDGDRAPIFSWLGKIFGVKVDEKKSIDTSKYEKGAVPFDGITRKAIIDVIPEHLSKIESLLSGASQRVYDYDTGKWVSAIDIKKHKEDLYNNSINKSFDEINPYIERYLKLLEKQNVLSVSEMDSLKESIFTMKKNVYESEEGFSPEQIIYNAKQSDDPLMEALGKMMKDNIPLFKLQQVFNDIADSKNSLARRQAEEERKGHSIDRKEYDNSKMNSHLVFDKDIKDYITGTKSNVNLLDIKDDHGYNVLNYLKELLINVSYIRQFGLADQPYDRITRSRLRLGKSYNTHITWPIRNMSGGRKVTRRMTKSSVPDFDTFSVPFNTQRVPDDLQNAKQKKIDADERHDKKLDKDKSEEDAIRNVLYKMMTEESWNLEDEDDAYKGIGRFYKSKSAAMKAMEAMPGDTFLEKWANAQTFQDKKTVLRGALGKVVRSPIEAVGNMIDSANASLYHFLFEAEVEEDDKKKKDYKGFFHAMLYKIQDKLSEWGTSLDNSIIKPFVRKYGLDEKWENLKNRIKNSKPMEVLMNAKDNVKDALFKDLGSAYSYGKSSIVGAIDNTLGTTDQIAQNEKDRKTATSKTQEKIDLANSIINETKAQLDKHVTDQKIIDKDDNTINAPGDKIVEEPGWKLLHKGEAIIPAQLAKYIRSTKDLRGILNNNVVSNEFRLSEQELLQNYLNELPAGILGQKAKLDKRYYEKELTKTNLTYNKNARDIRKEALDKKLQPVKDELINAGKYATDKAMSTGNKLIKSLLDIDGDTEKEQKESIDKQKKGLVDKAVKIFGEMKGEGAGTVSKAIIGGGLGLLSGIVGGPLIGAGIGVASSFLKNSETINKAVFGEREYDENGMIKNQKGGIVSKEIQNAFKKYLPDMGKFGLLGTVASFLTPFGPLAGAAIGAGIGLAKNSQTMNDMIFGNEGLINDQRKDWLKKHLPKAGAGAAIGSVLGLLGPFGILGGAAIGAGAGLITTTEEFKELMFGEDDGNGNRFGGLKGALDEYFIQPLKDFGADFKEDFFGFIKTNMVDPLNDAITPIASEIAFQAKKIVFGVPKWLANLGKEYIGIPIVQGVNDYVIKPISDGVKSLFGGMFSRFKGLISLPFKAIGAVGDLARGHQIKQGRDVVGGAKDRLKYAEEKGINKYNYKQFDEHLAGASKEDLEQLTVRTGMLAHGSDYLDKELQKSRRALNRVLGDYYKLGLIPKKDKKSYNRIRQYIKDNDIEAAINELTQIQETRMTGGPLNADAQEAIARFAKVNKDYQIARDNKAEYENITDNDEWMREKFGDDWKDKMDAKKLFEYSRRELARTEGGKNVTKADLFKDPESIISKGEEQIDNTLNKILKVLTNPKGKFMDEEYNEEWDKKAESATDNALFDIKLDKARIKNKFKGRDFSDDTINLLYDNKGIYELVLEASSKGINYDQDTIKKLCDLKLDKGDIKLLKKFPYIALMDESTIKKSLNELRNDRTSIFTNDLFGARAIRNNNLRTLNDTISRAESKGGKLSLEEGESFKQLETQWGLRKYIKNQNGELVLDMSDSETKESLKKEAEEKEAKSVLMGTLSGLKDSVFGIFNRHKEKDEEEKKTPWYKKLFNFDIGSKTTFGAAVLAGVLGVGALKNLWDNREPGGVIDTIGSKVGEYVGPYVTKVKNWFTNEGEYAPDKGLSAFADKYLWPNFYAGMEGFFGKVLPALVTSFIKAIPTLVKAGIEGVGSFLGWKKKVPKQSQVSISPASIVAVSSQSETATSASASGENVANSILGISTSDSNTKAESDSSEETNTGESSQSIPNPLADMPENTLVENMDGVGKIYVKDKNGQMVDATNTDILKQGGFYDKNGVFYQYDETTGNYTNSVSDSPDMKGNAGTELVKRLGYNAGRSILTGTKAGMFRGPSKAIFGGFDKVLSHTPIIKGPYKMGAGLIKGVTGAFEKTSFGVAEEAVEGAAKNTDRVASKVAQAGKKQNEKLLDKLIKKLDDILDYILNKVNRVKNLIKNGLKAAGKEATEEAAEKVSRNIIKGFLDKVKNSLSKSTKLLSSIVSAGAKTAFGIIIAAMDFIHGYDTAEEILGIANPNMFEKLVAGLANVANNWFFFGLISTSTVVDWCVDTIFPLFGISLDELKEERKKMEQEVAAYNAANPDDELTIAEYAEQEYSTWGKIKNFFKGNKKTNKTTTPTITTNNTRNRRRNERSARNIPTYAASSPYAGRGTQGNFVSQLDPKYKSKKFNISGDTEYQTLGDSGCAPATAANVINLFSGNGSVMDNAATAALKYKDRNGGVTPDYFTNYLGSKGIGTYPTTNQQEIMQGISSGKPIILLGTDPTNKANTPYGASSSHYVLATGMDGKGNVIIQDPESRKPNALYPVNEVVRQSHMGMIAGRGLTNKTKSITRKLRSKLGKVGFGRGTAEIEQQVWSSLRSAGYSEEQVAGAMGNIKHESGFDPSRIEDGSGEGFGLCQWTGRPGRRTQVENYAKSTGRDPSDLTAQIEFLIAEMTPGGGANGYAKYQFMDSNYSGTYYTADAFANAKDVETATRAFCFCFERPSAQYSHIDKRIKSAKEYYSKYTGTAVSSDINGNSGSNNTANNIFSKLSSAVMSYYDEGLLELFGMNDTDVSQMSSTSSTGGVTINNDVSGIQKIILDKAAGEVGTKAKSNKDTKYGKAIGKNNVDWCVIFCWWVFNDAGYGDLFCGNQKVYDTGTLYHYYDRMGATVGKNEGQPGDLIFFDWDRVGANQHVGIIEKNNGDGTYITIEGNTNTTNYPDGEVARNTRDSSFVYGIARVNYSSGKGSGNKFKSNQFLSLDGRGTKRVTSSRNIAAAVTNRANKSITKPNYNKHNTTNNIPPMVAGLYDNASNFSNTSTGSLSGRGTNAKFKDINSVTYSSKSKTGKSSYNLPSLSGRATTGNNGTVYSGTSVYNNNRTTSGNSTDKLLSIIIEVLQTIANNSEKLSEIVTLLSKALDLNLTDNDISKLSSNNAQIKNKIANALKSQGSANGLGNSVMDSSTESLANAMYSIARA